MGEFVYKDFPHLEEVCKHYKEYLLRLHYCNERSEISD